jgi:HlyD family secretion protein
MFEARLQEAEGRLARLEAEREGVSMKVPLSFNLKDSSARKIYESEKRIFKENRDRLEMGVLALNLKFEQAKYEAAGLQFKKMAILGELQIAQTIFEDLKILQASGSIEKSKIDQIEREVTRMQGELGGMVKKIAANKSRQQHLLLERGRILTKAQAEAHREIRELEPKITEIRQELVSMQGTRDRAILRAPTSGIINEIYVATIGEVIPPGKTVLTIVPDKFDLIIDFRIASTDIDSIAPGQPARLRFPSFNQRLTPEIEGVVYDISAAAITDPTSGEIYYSARAKATDVLANSGPNTLTPGMPVEIYIPTGERIAISYLIQPIMDNFKRGMREE